MEKMILLYILIMNLVGIVMMKLDKSKAEKKAWRIPEKTLLGIAAIGGAVGIWTGMYVFRHKTKTWYFVMGVPISLALNIYVLYMIYTHN